MLLSLSFISPRDYLFFRFSSYRILSIAPFIPNPLLLIAFFCLIALFWVVSVRGLVNNIAQNHIFLAKKAGW